MSKILAVFGATGQQGSSIVNYVLNDPEFSQQFKIRAITRDTTSEKAKELSKKVEVVQGDVLDKSSLGPALTGVHTVYAMSTPSFGPDGPDVEFNSGKAIADAAVEKGVEYFVWSTLPAVSKISGGKYTKVGPFEAKARVEEYIRSLSIKSSFISLGYFMENLAGQPYLAPRPAPDGTWTLERPNSPNTQLTMLDAIGDTGKFFGAILAEPDKYEGKTFCAAQGLYTLEEVAAHLSKSTGKTVVYKQVPMEDFLKALPFDGPLADVFAEAFKYGEEFGYFGPGTKELVEWAVENARGRLSSLEEFLEAHPLQLA